MLIVGADPAIPEGPWPPDVSLVYGQSCDSRAGCQARMHARATRDLPTVLDAHARPPISRVKGLYAVVREGEVERETGFEPATFCLGSRHSAS